MANINIIIIILLACSLSNCQNIDNSNSLSESKDSLVSEIVNDDIVQPKNSIKPQEEAKYKVVGEILTPEGFSRISIDSNTFGYDLRNFPLRTEDNTVYQFDGNEKWTQNVHFAVLNIDCGTQDLQQCADAVMRLRAEYLFEQKRYSDIHFNFLSDGKPRYYTVYAGNDRTHKKFRKYMNYIFSYANTASLKKELKAVNIEDMQVGDVFIQSGNPYGHAIIIMDMAVNETGEKLFMISQSYMPAQDIHILVNKNNSDISPWYSLDFGESLFTPEWTFTNQDLKRFAE